MEHLTCDQRLPLESQFTLAMVAQQAAGLDAEQLRECLVAAWNGWLLERHLTRQALDTVGVQIDLRVMGYTPQEVCHGLDR